MLRLNFLLFFLITLLDGGRFAIPRHKASSVDVAVLGQSTLEGSNSAQIQSSYKPVILLEKRGSQI